MHRNQQTHTEKNFETLKGFRPTPAGHDKFIICMTKGRIKNVLKAGREFIIVKAFKWAL